MKTKIMGLLAAGLLTGPISAHAALYFVRENIVGPTLYVDSETSVSTGIVRSNGNITSGSANLADGTLKAYAEAPSESGNTANAWVDLGDTLTVIGLTAPTFVTLQLQLTGTNSGNSFGGGGGVWFGRSGFSCSSVHCAVNAPLDLVRYGSGDPTVSELVTMQVPVDPTNASFTFHVWLVAQANPGGIADFGKTVRLSLILPEGLSFSSASGVFLSTVQPQVQLTLKQPAVAGCKSVIGRVTLPSPAPAGGLVVSISDTLAAAVAPATVKIAEGATSKSFTIKTTPVAADETGTVTISLDGTSSSQPLTVRPMGLSAVKLSPSTVVGGLPSTGTATLECKAGPSPITVDLHTSQPALANPVAASIVVPQGLQSATFDVSTNPVLVKSTTTISGTANGITKSKKLTVNVAPAVNPTSLKLGSVLVGQTSAPLSATLMNKGAVPFAVSSINLMGTAASWFAQTNNCPASLAPGASCAIAVTFTPLAASSKSAKLSIATGATATPLSVSLSGTGVLPP